MDVKGFVRRFNEEQQIGQALPLLSPEEQSQYQAGLTEVRQVFERFGQSRPVVNTRVSQNVHRTTYMPVYMGRRDLQVGNRMERLPISVTPELDRASEEPSEPANIYRLKVFVPGTEPGGSLHEQYGELNLGSLEINMNAEATPYALRQLGEFSELLGEVSAEATVEGLWVAISLISLRQTLE